MTEKGAAVLLDVEDAGSDVGRHCVRRRPLARALPRAGRSIWSVSPEELTALAAESYGKAESATLAKRRAHAVTNKYTLEECELQRAVQRMKEMAAERPTRTLKKYYGLPHIPLRGPLPKQYVSSFLFFSFAGAVGSALVS